jgi:hypothetical protein
MAVINADLDLAVTPGGRPGDASPLARPGYHGKRKLSDYEREVAHALMRKGTERRRAIMMARGIIRNAAIRGKWGRGHVRNPAVAAGAAASIAQRKAFAEPVGSVVDLAKLKAKARKKLKKSQFALPEKRAYPINDRAHAIAALRMRGHASPAEQARIVAAVRRRYPDIGTAIEAAGGDVDLAIGRTFRYRHGWIKINDDGKLGNGFEVPHRDEPDPKGLLSGRYKVPDHNEYGGVSTVEGGYAPDVPGSMASNPAHYARMPDALLQSIVRESDLEYEWKPAQAELARRQAQRIARKAADRSKHRPVVATPREETRSKPRAADVKGRKKRRRARAEYARQREIANRIIGSQKMRTGKPNRTEKRPRTERDYDIGKGRLPNLFTGGLAGQFAIEVPSEDLILGENGAHWRHGWIPLNPEAVTIKERMGAGGGHHKAGTFPTPGAKKKKPVRNWKGHYTRKNEDPLKVEKGETPSPEKARAIAKRDAEYEAHRKYVDDYLLAHAHTDNGGVNPKYGTYDKDTDSIKWTRERRAMFKKLVATEFRKQVRQGARKDKKAIFLGGLPGAGKSRGLQNVLGDVENQYITVNPDIFKERMAHMGLIDSHPGLSPLEASAFHHEESAMMAEMLADHARKHGYNIIHDMTMNSVKSATKRLDPLDADGYHSTAMFFDIPHDFSAQSVAARHKGGWIAAQHNEGHPGQRYVPSSFVEAGKSATGASSKNREAFDAVRHRFADSQLYHQGTTYEGRLIGRHPGRSG